MNTLSDIEYELPKIQEKDGKRGNIPDKKIMENEKQSLQLEGKLHNVCILKKGIVSLKDFEKSFCNLNLRQ